MTRLLAGAFFTASIAGFAADLMQLDAHSLGRGFFWPVLFGATAIGILVAQVREQLPLQCRA